MAKYTINTTNWTITDNSTNRTLKLFGETAFFVQLLIENNGEIVSFDKIAEKHHETHNTETYMDKEDAKIWIKNTKNHLAKELEDEFNLSEAERKKVINNLLNNVRGKGYKFFNQDAIFELRK